MSVIKTHTGIVITRDGPQVKKLAPVQSGCGSSEKTSFTTKKPDAATLQKIRAADC